MQVPSWPVNVRIWDYCDLKGQSLEIKVWLFWAEWKDKLLLISLWKGFNYFNNVLMLNLKGQCHENFVLTKTVGLD